MKKIILIAILATIIMSCSPPNEEETPIPAAGLITATIEGTAIKVSDYGIDYTNNILHIVANDSKGNQFALQIYNISTTGTYSLTATDSHAGFATYKSASVSMIYNSVNSTICPSYVPFGTLTVTELSSTKIAGTFAFNVVNLIDCADIKHITSGTFVKNIEIPKELYPSIATTTAFLSETTNWHIAQKTETTGIGSLYVHPNELQFMNNAFYESFMVLENYSSYTTPAPLHLKVMNNITSHYNPKSNGSDAWQGGFFSFFPNDNAEYLFDNFNANFRAFKNGASLYTLAMDSNVYPSSVVQTYNINNTVKKSVNYNPSDWKMTILDLPTGKRTNFKNVPYSGISIGNNNGGYVWDEDFSIQSPNNFKIFYGSIVAGTGNYNMHLSVAEISETNASVVGDPYSTGYFHLKQEPSKLFAWSLAGLGYNFGDSQINGFLNKNSNKVYFILKGKALPEPMKMYEYNIATKQIALIKAWATAELPLTNMQNYRTIFYRPIHNDVVFVSGQKLFKMNLSTYAIVEISPTLLDTPEPPVFCQVGERIYGITAKMNANKIGFKSNLFYYE